MTAKTTAPAPAPTTCAAPGCDRPVPRGGTGRPAIYCSLACRPSYHRPGILVEIDHPDASPDGRPTERVWTVRLRRGQRAVVIADNLGWPSAHALARQLNDVIHPRQHEGGAID
ncbi:MAG: hypothetical protein ACRD0M_03970 [Acidimicrobiales bacterium]